MLTQRGSTSRGPYLSFLAKDNRRHRRGCLGRLDVSIGLWVRQNSLVAHLVLALDGQPRQTNPATVRIDGDKTTSIPCKKSGIDVSPVPPAIRAIFLIVKCLLYYR